MSSKNKPLDQWAWQEVAQTLRERIVSGQYAPGSRLPGRRQLVEELNAADRTIAAAMHELQVEGLVYPLPRSGWYVRTVRPIRRMSRSRLSKAEREAGRGTFSSDAYDTPADTYAETERHWSETEVSVGQASEEVAGFLGVDPGHPVLVRDRVHFMDGEPAQLAVSYIPGEIADDVPAIQEVNTGPGGMYRRIEEAGYTMTSYSEVVRIGRANEDEASLLRIGFKDNVLLIRRIAYAAHEGQDGPAPVEVNFITAIGDRWELHYELPAT